MEVNTGESKHKVYRHTERRAEPAFKQVSRRLNDSSNNNTIIRCKYCNNLFCGVDRRAALQYLNNHVGRKHPERIRSL